MPSVEWNGRGGWTESCHNILLVSASRLRAVRRSMSGMAGALVHPHTEVRMYINVPGDIPIHPGPETMFDLVPYDSEPSAAFQAL